MRATVVQWIRCALMLTAASGLAAPLLLGDSRLGLRFSLGFLGIVLASVGAAVGFRYRRTWPGTVAAAGGLLIAIATALIILANSVAVWPAGVY